MPAPTEHSVPQPQHSLHQYKPDTGARRLGAGAVLQALAFALGDEGVITPLDDAPQMDVVDPGGDETSTFLESLESGAALDGLPPIPNSPPAAASSKPKAKRARQNAEAQRNYRRREKEQKDRAASAAQELQAYMNGAEEQLNEVLRLVCSDPVVLQRLIESISDGTEDSDGEAEASDGEGSVQAVQAYGVLNGVLNGEEGQLLGRQGDRDAESMPMDDTGTEGAGATGASWAAALSISSDQSPLGLTKTSALVLPPIPTASSSSSYEFCIQNDGFCIQTCIQNDEFCRSSSSSAFDASACGGLYASPVLPYAASTTRQKAERNQRLLLNLPGDRYIEGEIDALAVLHKEVTATKAMDEKNGAYIKWSRFGQVPQHFGKSMSDLLLCFVRWGRQIEAVPPPPPKPSRRRGASDGGSATSLQPPHPGTLDEPIFNVDRSYRKLLCYVTDINQFWQEYGFAAAEQGNTDFNASYSQGCCFVGRRQAVDGTTVLHSDLGALMLAAQEAADAGAPKAIEATAVGFSMALHAMMFDPETQRNGYTAIFDASGVTSKAAVRVTELMMPYWECIDDLTLIGLPIICNKNIHVNMPRAFTVAFKFISRMFPKNLRDFCAIGTPVDVVELVGGIEELPRFWDCGADGLCDDVDRFTALSPAELVSMRSQNWRRHLSDAKSAARGPSGFEVPAPNWGETWAQPVHDHDHDQQRPACSSPQLLPRLERAGAASSSSSSSSLSSSAAAARRPSGLPGGSAPMALVPRIGPGGGAGGGGVAPLFHRTIPLSSLDSNSVSTHDQTHQL